MQTYNIHEARTHLSRLIEQATQGEPFIIARAGKPLVKVTTLKAAEMKPKPKSRIGFLKDQFERGEFRGPDDFDTMCADEILELFGIEK
ncbi:MAG: type II toxin-antitoxin system prevent-host-death family antitoxin [Zoogloeaceae bacterium]|jgi:prevent-host-death family protein|nr:type II toxin-antitoxin system prevent-host-death family antitoxin [Zoogloeaceae bacterium]